MPDLTVFAVYLICFNVALAAVLYSDRLWLKWTITIAMAITANAIAIYHPDTHQ